MLRGVLFAPMVAVLPTLAFARPKEDSRTVFDKFLTAFTAADIDTVVSVFWPDVRNGGGV